MNIVNFIKLGISSSYETFIRAEKCYAETVKGARFASAISS